jgi:O-antigen/teichoic acid export membrane protein
MTPSTRRVRALLGASATVTLATVAVNLLSYALVAVGTRSLGPERYAELAALLGLLLVGYVPAATVQVVVARRVAAGEAGGLGRATVRTAVAVTVIGAIALPILHLTLRISVPSLIFLVAALPAMTLGGAPMGATQGLHLFGRLAATTTIVGAGRVGGAIAGLAVGGTAASSMAGMLIGAWLALFAACAAARGPAWQALTARDREQARAATREIAHATLTMLAMAAVMTADVLLAKRYLPAADAGQYGAGAIVTKVAIWLPYAVTMIALPRLAVARHRRTALRVSIAVRAALGVVEVAGILVLGDVLFPLAVGDEYRPVIPWLWLFATLGAVLAITQLVIMSRIAATDRLVAALLWAGLIAEIVAVTLFHGSIGTILTIATITALTVALAGLLVPIRSRSGAEPDLPVGSLTP